MQRLICLCLFVVLSCLFVCSLNAKETKEKAMNPDIKHFHELLAPALFNASWDLLEKEDRTPEDEAKLINLVHASLYHWRQIGTPLNIVRGEWMISHIYTLLKHKESALYHAQNCLSMTLENQFKDFDLAYAYEAMARAHALAGNKGEFSKYYELAISAGNNIAQDGDRQQFESDMKDANWFGMK